MEEGDGEFVPEAPTRHYPVDTAGRTPFSKLCKLFEALSKTSVRGGIGVRSWNSDAKSASLKEKRQHMLKQFMSEWRDTQGDFYPAMRLLLPQVCSHPLTRAVAAA